MDTTRYRYAKRRGRGERGFTLLLAALVASAVLAIGAAIYMLAVKQVDLSSLGRDSQFAFYTADAAAECALFWDSRYLYFDVTAPVDVIPPDPRCDGRSLNATGRTGIYPQTMQFTYTVGGRCAQVSIYKCMGSIRGTWPNVTCAPDQPVVTTIIHADGYSVSCGLLDVNPRTLQRSVELNY